MTAIEWTDRTWNHVVGCSRVSAGCEHCYAERLAHRGLTAAHKGLTVAGPKGPRWTGEVRCLPERLEEPLRWRKPQRIFVNSMSDLFHEGVPDEYIDRVWAVMMLSPHHTYQILTKRPERMRSYLSTPGLYDRVLRAADGFREKRPALMSVPISNPASAGWRPHIWLGVSIEDQLSANERIPLLLQTPAAVRFVSYEPALGPVDFRPTPPPSYALSPELRPDRIGWVIVGGESGPGARPCDVEWIRSTVRQCREASVPAFVKQLGARPYFEVIGDESPREIAAEWNLAGVPEERVLWDDAGECWLPQLRDRKGGDPAEWPADLRVREMPGGAAR